MKKRKLLIKIFKDSNIHKLEEEVNVHLVMLASAGIPSGNIYLEFTHMATSTTSSDHTAYITWKAKKKKK